MFWKIYFIWKTPKKETFDPIVKIYKGRYFRGGSKTERKRKWIEREDQRGNPIQRLARGSLSDQERSNRVVYHPYSTTNRWREN